MESIARVRGVSKESLAGYEGMMIGALKAKSPDALSQWMRNQVYLALGFFLGECAHRHIDACPMEGFDAKKFDEILGLPAQNLQSVVLCPVGYRAIDDQYAHLKKVRFDQEEIFIDR